MGSCPDTDIDQVYPYEMHTRKWFNRGLKEIKHCIVFSLLFSVTGTQTHTTLRPIICAKSAADFSHVIGRKVALVCAQITLSTQLIMINYPVILFHRRSTTVS